MDTPLSQTEARVLGSLIEKEMTTPEYYPLTLAALTAACNQKSNRSPVMQLLDTEVVRELDSLRDRKLAWETSSSGGRVPKYRHGAAELLKLSSPQLAIICELILRGPQTAAELRIHTARMAELPGTDEVIAVLNELMQRPEGALVTRLGRCSGQREERYAQLLCGPVETDAGGAAPEPARMIVASENERIAKLEAEIASLREQMTGLRAELTSFMAQFK